MLPDWDFDGDEAKRRAFIGWVEAELDRFAMLTTDRHRERGVLPADWLELARAAADAPQPVGRPAEPFKGMNAMVWEFGLLRYMFNRYWPGRKRPIGDPASAASIAVARNRRALPREQRTADRLRTRADNSADTARRLFEEWERGSKSPGRTEAERDIAFLEQMPPNHFAR